MMYWGSRILLLLYYQYTHLSKLLPPLSNNRRLQHNFSEIAILTQNFNNTIDVDINDALDSMDALLKRKLGLLSASDYLIEHQREKASLALDHISHVVGVPVPQYEI